jgi:hypothetical protein
MFFGHCFVLIFLKLDNAARKGYSDNCRSLCENCLKYIPCIPDITLLKPNQKKDQQGFCHHSTAHLLCPWHLRDKFDRDRDQFCSNVLNGKMVISHTTWPSFPYPEDGYNPLMIDENLLHGLFLLSVSPPIFFRVFLTLSPVLQTYIYWPMHSFEGHTRSSTWQEAPCRHVQHGWSEAWVHCLCHCPGMCSLTLSWHQLTCIPSVVMSSMEESHSHCMMVTSMLLCSTRGSLTSSPTNCGLRRHWHGGTSKISFKTCFATNICSQKSFW